MTTTIAIYNNEKVTISNVHTHLPISKRVYEIIHSGEHKLVPCYELIRIKPRKVLNNLDN